MSTPLRTSGPAPSCLKPVFAQSPFDMDVFGVSGGGTSHEGSYRHDPDNMSRAVPDVTAVRPEGMSLEFPIALDVRDAGSAHRVCMLC